MLCQFHNHSFCVVPAVCPWRRRHCKCKKSQCLKLCCDCFATQVICEGCDCSGCRNTHLHAQLVEARCAQLKAKKNLVRAWPAVCVVALKGPTHEHQGDAAATKRSVPRHVRVRRRTQPCLPADAGWQENARCCKPTACDIARPDEFAAVRLASPEDAVLLL